MLIYIGNVFLHSARTNAIIMISVTICVDALLTNNYCDQYSFFCATCVVWVRNSDVDTIQLLIYKFWHEWYNVIERIELPAKLLDYFLRSNKSNINQK